MVTVGVWAKGLGTRAGDKGLGLGIRVFVIHSHREKENQLLFF